MDTNWYACRLLKLWSCLNGIHYFTALWTEWIEDERKVLEDGEGRDAINALFERAMKDYTCKWIKIYSNLMIKLFSFDFHWTNKIQPFLHHSFRIWCLTFSVCFMRRTKTYFWCLGCCVFKSAHISFQLQSSCWNIFSSPLVEWPLRVALKQYETCASVRSLQLVWMSRRALYSGKHIENLKTP